MRMLTDAEKKTVKYFFYFCIFLLIAACGSDGDFYSPKRKAYFRIDFPKKSYTTYDSICPFIFDVPKYAVVMPDKDAKAEPCWLNIVFPKYKATIHITYKRVDKNLSAYLEDSHTLAVKHQVKASGLEEEMVVKDSVKVYGLIYNIEGNAASSLQFYLTDSTTNFLRGSLYFMSRPNADSLDPILAFIKEDIHRMIQSFKWKRVEKK